MSELKQGANYEEEAPERPLTPPPENNSNKSKTKLIAIVAAGAVLVILLFAIIISVSVSSSKKKEDTPPTEEELIASGYMYNQDGELVPPSEFDKATFSYTPDEKAQLRQYGYTGSDIETNELAEIPAQQLIDQVIKDREELEAQFASKSSPAYQELLQQTWLGGEILQTPTDPTLIQSTTVKRANVDYVKIPPHGNQLFVRLNMPDGKRSFMCVSPVTYAQLNDSGNIVVDYTVVTFPDAEYITEITEVTL